MGDKMRQILLGQKEELIKLENNIVKIEKYQDSLSQLIEKIDEEKKNDVNELNQKFIAFDSNKIISFTDYKYEEKNRRFYYELDRVSGILVQTSSIFIDRYGNEYVEDDGKTYLRNSIYFQNHVYADKYVCENNKKL